VGFNIFQLNNMYKLYKTTAALLIALAVAKHSSAQTHYGAGAGTQGTSHAFFGTDAGKVNSGSYNTFLGYYSGRGNKTGHSNTFLGSYSGANNTEGNDNVVVGHFAGLSNLTGTKNTFLGSNSGRSNTIGDGNVFLGFYTGHLNTMGTLNTFVGSLAGANNGSGSFNTFLGGHAGQLNESGEYNTFLGNTAGISNLTGSHNAYIGSRAGYFNANGNFNCIIGSYANGDGKTGNENCIVGSYAGYRNEANNNTFTGTYAGFENSSGHENAFFGHKAGQLNKSGQGNTFIGSQSGTQNGVGIANAFLGAESGYGNTTGSNNAFLGYGSGYLNTTGEKNTYLGYASGGNPTLTNATAIGALAKVTASNSLVLGNNAKVGIGLSAPAYQLQLSTDQAAKLGSPDWTVASDRRLKKDISDFTDGLALIKQIKPVWFSYNGAAGAQTGEKRFVGIIAQEMQQIAPYTIGSFTYQDSLGQKSEYLDYDGGAVTYMLINAVKEQQAVIEQLLSRLEKLETAGSSTKQALDKNRISNEQLSGEVKLGQNAPNGFSTSSTIKYEIAKDVKTAVLKITDNAGNVVKTYPITERGQSQLTISASEFTNGIYLYELITDGKSTGAKKMLISK
jgi:hypothetical protein